MPKRSLDSFVLRWPSPAEVEQALRDWLEQTELPGLLALGYFGSYARGESGPGSDLDLVLVLKDAPEAPWERTRRLPLELLPVPTEALVFTLAEWRALPEARPRFARTLTQETRWLKPPP